MADLPNKLVNDASGETEAQRSDEEQPEVADILPSPSEHQPTTTMTKSQMKKLARRQRLLEKRPEKRRLEREKRRRKKAEILEKRLQEQSEGGDTDDFERKPAIKSMSKSDNKFKVVIDMDFEDLMTDDEIGKAAKQCKRAYAINRRALNPCQLYFTSVKNRIRDRFNVTCAGYESWDANVTDLDYNEALTNAATNRTNSGDNLEPADADVAQKVKQSIIYLTGDTDEILPDVDEILKDDCKIFVIGGLVDHNRHKSLCFERAQERGLRTAKLPISENLRLCQRHILSTVTVFDILLNVLSDHKSWRESLMASIPRRKIHPSEFDKNKPDADGNG